MFFSSCNYSVSIYFFTLFVCNSPLKICKNWNITDFKKMSHWMIYIYIYIYYRCSLTNLLCILFNFVLFLLQYFNTKFCSFHSRTDYSIVYLLYLNSTFDMVVIAWLSQKYSYDLLLTKELDPISIGKVSILNYLNSKLKKLEIVKSWNFFSKTCFVKFSILILQNGRNYVKLSDW